MKEEITLVVVDCQYDFCNPTGAIASIDGGKRLNDFVREQKLCFFT